MSDYTQGPSGLISIGLLWYHVECPPFIRQEWLLVRNMAATREVWIIANIKPQLPETHKHKTLTAKQING